MTLHTKANEAMKPREKLNVVRLAYGLLWHSKSDDKIVHKARKVLLDWLDSDQRKIGIEEAKNVLKR